MGNSPTAIAGQAAAQDACWTQTPGRPAGIDGDPVRLAVRYPEGDAAAGNGLWLGHDVTQLMPLVEGIAPIAAKRGRPLTKPQCV